MKFATGYREDKVPRNRPGHRGIAAKYGIVQDTGSMLAYYRQLWQGLYGMCFPTSVTEATWMQSAARGSASLISPVFGYGVSRAQEFRDLPAGEQPTTLEDTGCEPGCLEDAYKIMGLVSWGVMPGPADPRFDERLVTTLSDPAQPDIAQAWQDAITAAYDKRSLVVSEIDVAPSGRGDACADLLNRHLVPIIAWYVDDAYMQNRGQLVTSMGLGFPNHAQAVLEVDPDELRLANWWACAEKGYEWGLSDGTCRVSRKLFEQLPAVQCRIFAITFLPEVLP